MYSVPSLPVAEIFNSRPGLPPRLIAFSEIRVPLMAATMPSRPLSKEKVRPAAASKYPTMQRASLESGLAARLLREFLALLSRAFLSAEFWFAGKEDAVAALG